MRNSLTSSLTFIPRLIYNRTIRAIENLRGKEEIELVTLVNNFEKIEERFKRRRDFLNEQCEKLGLNETTDTYDLDDITDNILAGKFRKLFSHFSVAKTGFQIDGENWACPWASDWLAFTNR